MNGKAKILKLRLDELRRADIAWLRVRWREAFAGPAPPKISRDLLIRALAYRLQEEAYGGLKPATKRQLRRLAKDLRQNRSLTASLGQSLSPGVRLMREWQGETHVVEVLSNGFAWRGNTYPSLSAIARTITGTRWSGPRFFGLLADTGPARSASGKEALDVAP